jgi:hypothetical protein
MGEFGLDPKSKVLPDSAGKRTSVYRIPVPASAASGRLRAARSADVTFLERAAHAEPSPPSGTPR